MKALAVVSIAWGVAAAKQQGSTSNLHQQHSLPVPARIGSHAFQTIKAASLRRPISPSCFTAPANLSRSQSTLPYKSATERFKRSSSLSRSLHGMPITMTANVNGTSVAGRAKIIARRAHDKGAQINWPSKAPGQQADAYLTDADASDTTGADVHMTADSAVGLGSSMHTADVGSLDNHFKFRPPTAPEQRWRLLADAAGFDLASGLCKAVAQQPLAMLPDKLANSSAAVHCQQTQSAVHSQGTQSVTQSQQDLQLREVLTLTQDELSSSADSSLVASPRAISHAVECVPKLRARTAVSSHGSSNRPTPRTDIAAITRHLLDPARYNSIPEDDSSAEQRLAKLSMHQATSNVASRQVSLFVK